MDMAIAYASYHLPRRLFADAHVLMVTADDTMYLLSDVEVSKRNQRRVRNWN